MFIQTWLRYNKINPRYSWLYNVQLFLDTENPLLSCLIDFNYHSISRNYSTGLGIDTQFE